MAIVFMGMVILGLVLALLNRKKQRTWLFVLTLVVDIIAIIGCTYYAVQAMKTNDAQKEFESEYDSVDTIREIDVR